MSNGQNESSIETLKGRKGYWSRRDAVDDSLLQLEDSMAAGSSKGTSRLIPNGPTRGGCIYCKASSCIYQAGKVFQTDVASCSHFQQCGGWMALNISRAVVHSISHYMLQSFFGNFQCKVWPRWVSDVDGWFQCWIIYTSVGLAWLDLFQ